MILWYDHDYNMMSWYENDGQESSLINNDITIATIPYDCVFTFSQYPIPFQHGVQELRRQAQKRKHPIVENTNVVKKEITEVWRN